MPKPSFVRDNLGLVFYHAQKLTIGKECTAFAFIGVTERAGLSTGAKI